MREPTSTPAASQTAPLNAAQRGVLASHVQDPDSADMTIGVVSVIRPAPDVERFREATARAYSGVDGVRVRVAKVDGQWRQWVDEDAVCELVVHDVSQQADPAAAADRLVDLLTRTRLPLDASTPLLVPHLVVLGPHEARWLSIAHHVAGDGFSGVMLRLRAAQWYAHLSGVGPAPAEPQHSVREAWARADEGRDERTLERWVTALGALPQRITLADRDGAAGAGSHRSIAVVDGPAVFSLGPASGQRSWAHPVTGIFAAYTARVTEVDRVVLGFVVAGRQLPRDGDIATQLARIVPLAVTVDPSADLTALAAASRAAVAQARELGPVTAEELRAAHPAAWRTGRVHGPTLNIIPFEAEVVLPGHSVTSRIFNRGPVDDLHLAVAPGGGGIELDLVTNAAAYSAEETERHVRRVARLVELAAARPTMPVLDLDPSLPEEIATRDEWTARTGLRIVDTRGRTCLLGQPGELVDAEGTATGRLAVLHPSGQFEELGTLADRVLVHGFPVYTERLRQTLLDQVGVHGVELALAGRRFAVTVHPHPGSTLSASALTDLCREMVPRMTAVRLTVADPGGPNEPAPAGGDAGLSSSARVGPADDASAGPGR